MKDDSNETNEKTPAKNLKNRVSPCPDKLEPELIKYPPIEAKQQKYSTVVRQNEIMWKNLYLAHYDLYKNHKNLQDHQRTKDQSYCCLLQENCLPSA